MGLQKELATLAMRATPLPGGGDNFMAAANIPTPVPLLPGSIGAVAHEPFMARETRRSFDLLVAFTIGDFADSTGCSEYYNPHSPWYNVFYGAYGLRSYEPDGSAWGFHTDGTPNIPEMLQVPELDYNWLTAGALGCPPPRMCFRTEEVKAGRHRSWHVLDVAATIPSGLHYLRDAVSPDLRYYAVFGLPGSEFMAGGRQSYEPVRMRGRMLYKQVGSNLTLAWGGLCPDTSEGQRLLSNVLDAMDTLYPG
ncbi:hypothetical protein ACN28I_24745 [Archangium gephyra]|uniref:hypothetical protein n=1 Tax=Archangium gephyra TaxID=48 RepID=UPI003B7682DD